MEKDPEISKLGTCMVKTHLSLADATDVTIRLVASFPNVILRTKALSGRGLWICGEGIGC